MSSELIADVGSKKRDTCYYFKMNINEFLTGLSALSQKYGIKIEGCGCCGSPALVQIKPEAVNGCYKVNEKNENLNWTAKKIVADN